MQLHCKHRFLMKRLVAYFLLSNSLEVVARPASQDQETTGGPTTGGPTPVTAVATSNGQAITEVFTPTSVSISGITPPITKATTITTTDKGGQTVAIAIAAGAGIVGAGALAAWLFKPTPGGPPAPTEPPKYPTSKMPEPSKTDPPKTTTTTEKPAACPFSKVDAKKDFTSIPLPAKWTGDLPSQTVSSISPKCTQQGSNKQLLRGTDPGYVKALAEIFCKNDLSKDQSKKIGQKDISGGDYKNSRLDGISVKFDFKFALKNDACPKNCVDSYTRMLKNCQYNSHSIYGGASLEQGCGSYSFIIDAIPNTKMVCNNADKRGVFFNYAYRDAALDSIKDFCKTNNGKIIKQNDQKTWIKENSLSVTYAANCRGSGEYKITESFCNEYLQQVVDNCDTDTRAYKHGGNVTDVDNCGAFAFNPTGFDTFDCYPKNKEHGFITQGTHTTISPAVAQDAINAFCDREGDGQTYTLDPAVTPNSGFVQDTCKEKGLASCAYFYTKDGKRVTKSGDLGDFVVRMSAMYLEQGHLKCGSRQKYEIHGDRCKSMLNKVIGVEPKGMCVGSDANKLDLGSFLESGDKGCVLWNMWTVETH
ncbi:hypothetical protein PRK78_005352 [Emydomyces testavorans]|uniref:Uncharacterized protein n=1 Tax=Emydomyces testavorans TaxID=2070801 RepID=A0AAF0DLW8_9EURO|nr:hypothetical protein PRK78_005352 [Emydomyces testavorans]